MNQQTPTTAPTFDTSLPALAANILHRTDRNLSYSDIVVSRFLQDVILEVLGEQKVMSDIERRLRAGSGTSSCQLPHSHTSDCGTDYISRMVHTVVQSISDDPRLSRKIISKATSTWSNVLIRGKNESADPMDAATAKYVRRQILTETIAREIVSEVNQLHLTSEKQKSMDGFLFALPQTLREKFPDQEELFNQALSQIPPQVMSNIMTKGYGVIDNFTNPASTCWNELERIDAMGLFAPVPGYPYSNWWTTHDTLSHNRPPYTTLASMCEKLSNIPFELNSKHKGLMIQVISNIQLMVLPPSKDDITLSGAADGVKFFCFIPVTEQSENSPTIIRNDHVSLPCGSLVIMDPRKLKFVFPSFSQKRFFVSAYLTGPS